MSVPSTSAPLRFRTQVKRCLNSTTWMLIMRHQAEYGPHTQAEYRFPTRSEACQVAIRIANNHLLPFAEWEESKQFDALQADLNQLYERVRERSQVQLSPEKEAEADAYLAAHPEVQQQIKDLFS